MVDSRKLGYQIDDAIDTGRDNAAIRTDVEGWCEHLTVETVGVSPLGQAVGLPIGMHRLSCQYAQYSTQSIVLRSLFQSFLVDNCSGCAHHKPGLCTEFGQAILNAAQQRETKAREDESKRLQQIESLRQELIQSADRLAATAQSQAASVFRLAVDLFTESECNATQMLCETSQVAPELFEDKVIELLELGVTDEVFAAKCLPVLACLARKDFTIRDRIRPRVIESSQLDLPVELISDSVDACLSEDAHEITDQLIDKLVALQNYQRSFGGWNDENAPDYSKTIALLAKLIDIISERVRAVIEQRLEINQKWPRANTCRVVEELSKLQPEFGLGLLPPLIRSLELDDDAYEGVSADGSALHTVSELLVLRWKETDEILQREMSRLSADAQAVLVGAYEKLFRRGDHWRDKTTERLEENIVSGAVNRCFELLNDANQPSGVRRAAAEAIHTACCAGAGSALNAFDQLLGCLAIVVESEPPPATPKIILPGQDDLQKQEELLSKQGQEFEWRRLQRELTEVIEEIGERDPLNVGNALLTTIEAATCAGHQALRLAALRLLGRIASHEPALASVALPSLMVCLMDYSSPSIRAVAIDAVTDAFRHSHLTVPSNVVDVIVLHLRDEYVVVHQAAVNAFRFWHIPLTELQRGEAFTALFYIWKAYAKNPAEAFFMDDIADALLSVAGEATEFRQLTLLLICEYLPTGEFLVDSKLCEKLTRNTEADTSTSVNVAKALIECLGRYDRDPYQHGRDWREEAADWLSSLSTQVWHQVSAEFNACAQHVLQRDPGEALLFAAVLCEYGEHAAEAQALATAADCADGHSFFHGLQELLLRLQKCALSAEGEFSE